MEFEKHLYIKGSSNISWEDAIEKTIEKASKTIDFIKGVDVIRQYGYVSGDRITMYHVELEISFVIDMERK